MLARACVSVSHCTFLFAQYFASSLVFAISLFVAVAAFRRPSEDLALAPADLHFWQINGRENAKATSGVCYTVVQPAVVNESYKDARKVYTRSYVYKEAGRDEAFTSESLACTDVSTSTTHAVWNQGREHIVSINGMKSPESGREITIQRDDIHGGAWKAAGTRLDTFDTPCCLEVELAKPEVSAPKTKGSKGSLGSCVTQ
eukprot:TRINITY_DN30089_c0_g1_i1.p1 TRINITY_DN30089_c0_g1~~TRINITY_DN30089_c0_g1_i1.p1  ORF type:complete len:201 (+),score=29.70 TRINITY_DN30089_c0_g1_i1:3-605(+)